MKRIIILLLIIPIILFAGDPIPGIDITVEQSPNGVTKKGKTNSKACIVSSDKKYSKRGSPPIPANSCPTGYVREGNDGGDYQAVSYSTKTGNVNRWVKCGKANTTC